MLLLVWATVVPLLESSDSIIIFLWVSLASLPSVLYASKNYLVLVVGFCVTVRRSRVRLPGFSVFLTCNGLAVRPQRCAIGVYSGAIVLHIT